MTEVSYIEACARYELDRHGVMKKHLAPIECDKKCAGCGWNPKEQARRLATGEFKPVHTRRGWSEEEGWHDVVLPEGTRQLVFKKKEATA